MKKQIIVIGICALLVLVVLSSGCTTSPPQEEKPWIEITIHDKRFADYINTTLNNYTKPDKENYTFYIINLTAKNVGNEKNYASPSAMSISTMEGKIYTNSWLYSLVDSFKGEYLLPNGSTTGKVVFEIPNGTTPKEFYYEYTLGKELTVPLT